MSEVSTSQLDDYCLDVARRAKRASEAVGQLRGDVKNRWLRESARRMRALTSQVLAANALDVAAAPGFGLTAAEVDRLTLTPARIESMAIGLEDWQLLLSQVVYSSN